MSLAPSALSRVGFFLLISLFITIQQFSISETVTAKPFDYHLFLIFIVSESHSVAEEELFRDRLQVAKCHNTPWVTDTCLVPTHAWIHFLIRFPEWAECGTQSVSLKAFLPPLPLHILQPAHDYCTAEQMSKWADLFLQPVGESWSC